MSLAPPAEALIFGDLHAENVEEKALTAAFEMIRELKCKRAIYHDLLDFGVRNHHSINDFCDRYRRATTDSLDSVKEELVKTIDILESTPDCA